MPTRHHRPVRDLELGRTVRFLRRRRGWRQQDCAERAGVHRSTWSRLERGRPGRMAVETLRRCLAVLEVTLDLAPHWRGAQLGRLLDERHARLEAAWKERLERWGWIVWAEVSYSRYGERGRADLIAWFGPLRILLIVEVKTEIVDLQALIGGLGAKVRLGGVIARELGVGTPALCIPVLIVAEGSANRDRVRRFSTLFAGFPLRGRTAVSWLRRPQAPSLAARDGSGRPIARNGSGQAVTPASGLLIFSDLRSAHDSRVKSVGSHRMRRPAASPSVASNPSRAPRAARVP